VLENPRKNQWYLYPIALIVGGTTMFAIWFVGITIFPIFKKVSLTGLMLPIAAGLVGGILTALIAPKYKIMTAILSAIVLTSPMLYQFLHMGFSHIESRNRNPFLWYWAAYVPISAMVGAFSVVKIQRKGLDRT